MKANKKYLAIIGAFILLILALHFSGFLLEVTGQNCWLLNKEGECVSDVCPEICAYPFCHLSIDECENYKIIYGDLLFQNETYPIPMFFIGFYCISHQDCIDEFGIYNGMTFCSYCDQGFCARMGEFPDRTCQNGETVKWRGYPVCAYETCPEDVTNISCWVTTRSECVGKVTCPEYCSAPFCYPNAGVNVCKQIEITPELTLPECSNHHQCISEHGQDFRCYRGMCLSFSELGLEHCWKIENFECVETECPCTFSFSDIHNCFSAKTHCIAKICEDDAECIGMCFGRCEGGFCVYDEIPPKPCDEAQWDYERCEWDDSLCAECQTDDDCFFESCCSPPAICIDGECEMTTCMTAPPCTDAVWRDYPECRWDISRCINWLQIGIIAIIILGLGTIIIMLWKRKRS